MSSVTLNNPTVRPEPIEGFPKQLIHYDLIQSWFDQLTTNGLNQRFPSELKADFDENGIALQLLTLPANTDRAAARLFARRHLQAWLALLLTRADIVLRESDSGPILPDSDLHISLSYAENKVLMGVCRGRKLGVDLVALADTPEREAIARLYFPQSWLARALSPPGFALAWAELEACCKALNLPLGEINPARERAYNSCQVSDLKQINEFFMAVATVTFQANELAQPARGEVRNGR